MAQVICYPNGAGSSTQWTAVGAATNWECVDEVSTDSDTTYVTINSALTNQRDFYTIDYSGLPVGAVITNVMLALRVRRETGSAAFNRLIKANGTSSSDSNTTVGTTYSFVTRSFATNPTTGVAWRYSDMASLEIGCGVTVVGTNYARITQCYAIIDYKLIKSPVHAFGLLPVPLL
jgi:hypothetical protein